MMTDPETALQRARQIAIAVVQQMPADDVVLWLDWCTEHGPDIVLRDAGELLYEIAVGGETLVLIPRRYLDDPDVTAIPAISALPTAPDDISELIEP